MLANLYLRAKERLIESEIRFFEASSYYKYIKFNHEYESKGFNFSNLQKFFPVKKLNDKELNGGPCYKDQVLSIANNKSWVVLNSSILDLSNNDSDLNARVNALKLWLQTDGPVANNIPGGVRNNEGEKVKAEVFHGHVKNSQGTLYVVEWSIIDSKNRVLVLTNFAPHENFPFLQKPLTPEEKDKYVHCEESEIIFQKVIEAQKNVKEKALRMQKNYKSLLDSPLHDSPHHSDKNKSKKCNTKRL